MKAFTDQQTDTLSTLVSSDRFSTGPSNRELHRRDISPHRGLLPAGIIWPKSTDEVADILSWCYENDVPVTPWGAGTSTEGNPVPTCGGLVINMSRMDKILVSTVTPVYGGEATLAELADLLQRGIQVRVAEKPFQAGGRSYEPAALVIRREGNPEDLPWLTLSEVTFLTKGPAETDELQPHVRDCACAGRSL